MFFWITLTHLINPDTMKRKILLMNEWENYCLSLKLRHSSENEKLEIINTIGMKRYVELALGYFIFSTKDLHRLKEDTESKLLKYINISELHPLLFIFNSK